MLGDPQGMKRPPHRVVTTLGLLACLGGCPGAATAPRDVQYSNSSPVGRWESHAGTGGMLLSGTAGAGAGVGAGVVASGDAGSLATGTAGVAMAGVGTAAGAGDTAGMDGAAGVVAAGMGGGTGLTMTFDVTTKSQGGNYAPRNVGAIWVATAAGQFVKALDVWAFLEASHLGKWNAETGGNRVDAVSRATLRAHETHHATWDLLDANGSPVPDGPYKVIIEVTDHNSPAGAWTSVDFTKGPTPMTTTAPDQPYFTGMQVSLQ